MHCCRIHQSIAFREGGSRDCLYGFLKNALQDLNLVTEASMLNHAPGNAHMGFVWVNAVQFAPRGQVLGNTDGRVANIATKLYCNLAS